MPARLGSLSPRKVAPALLRGERRSITLELPGDNARFDDRTIAVELNADYYDDNGVRNERLALVLEDTFVQLPPHLRY